MKAKKEHEHGPVAEAITLESRVRELYRHPVGHDVIRKILLQLNLPEILVTNPAIGHMRLRQLMYLTSKVVDESFWDSVLRLLNQEDKAPDRIRVPGLSAQNRMQKRSQENSRKQTQNKKSPAQRAWWKEAVFYQIYPSSFCDLNGDGCGDIPGIISRLDYLKNLGVDALWLSPVYDSPMADNGYDIRDYHAIAAQYGTMEDFDRLLEAVHARGMRLIMDLVVNHTSDEHAWYREALRDEKSPCRNYYIFREGDSSAPPNNWTSFFEGSAWKYEEEAGLWMLHLFDEKQPDLNWDNEQLRREVRRMVRCWLAKGVDGFRLDVINFISKTPGLPDGNELIGDMMGYRGIEHYFYGPKLHSYLRELREHAFEPYKAFSVGEMPGIGLEMGKLLTDESRGELDMMFCFDHLENPGKVRFDIYDYDLNYYKKYIMAYIRGCGDTCTPALFFENHDNPRILSKLNPPPALRAEAAKLIAALQLTLRGTPFIYQGQELATVNPYFKDISALRDVESLRYYKKFTETMTPGEALARVRAGSRDNARAPIDWDECAAQSLRHDSVLRFYKRLIRLRRGSEAFTYGDIHFLHAGKKNLFIYERRNEKERYYVECNLSAGEQKCPKRPGRVVRLLGNYADAPQKLLRPYEVNIYRYGRIR